MKILTDKKQRSVALQAVDKKRIKALIRQALTITAAADLLGLSRQTLSTIVRTGTCKPETLDKMRKYFNENMATA